MSRRDFLKSSAQLGLGVSAASLALSACEKVGLEQKGSFIGPNLVSGHRLKSDTAPNGNVVARHAKTVILGAGIAGLGAAWSLKSRGISDFAVLELEKQAGGNSRAHQIKNLACPMGAHYLPVPLTPQGSAVTSTDGLEPVRALLSELGLMQHRLGRWQVSAEGERHLCHSPQERLFFHGAWQEGLLPHTDVAESTLLEYRRFSEVIKGFQERGGFQLPMGVAFDFALSPAQLSERMALDRLSFRTWLDQQGFTDPHLHWYLDYCCRDDYGAGLSQVSAWGGVHYFASRHGFQAPNEPAREEFSTAGGVFTWPQGNGWLSEKIAASLGDKIQTETLAMKVEVTNHGLRINAMHGDNIEHWDCEHCILALPLFLSQRLLASSGHDANTLAALQEIGSNIEYSSWMVANAYLDRDLRDRGGAPPAWDNVIYGSQGLGYVNAGHQSLSQTSGPTVLTYYEALGAGKEVRKALLNRSWQSWRDSLLEEFKTAHPDFGERLQHLDIARFGHAMAMPKPGWHSELMRNARAHLVKPSARLSFAHSDLAGYSVFEEAFTLGVRAGQRR